MKYLGPYQSGLATWHLEELMRLLEVAFGQGEYAGGQMFDQTALDALRAEGQTFGLLPTASAGQRATDDALNRPLALLRVRFEALLRETATFDSRAAALLTILEKDSTLIDQLLAAATLEYWAATRPMLGTRVVAWDFGMGHGHVALDMAHDDPITQDADGANGVVYPDRPPVITFLTDQVRTGLAAPAAVRSLPVKALGWHVPASRAEDELLYGTNWAKLSRLESQPLIAYAGQPAVAPAITPFLVAGQSHLGTTPIYVRVFFLPRRNQRTHRFVKDEVLSLSAYPVSTDDVVVMAGGRLYRPSVDYAVTPEGTFTGLNDANDDPQLPVDQDTTIWFLEHFPAYQCSINQKDWSPTVMLDPTRPYPDAETAFHPIAFGRAVDGSLTAFPITDEIGNPTGLTLQRDPSQPAMVDEWLLKVFNPATPDVVGATAVLELEFEQPRYLNALRLAPFTTFPCCLQRIELEGLTADTRISVFDGAVRLDRPMIANFPRMLARRAYLTLYQENYTLKDYSLESADVLRREVMANLQSALPYAARRAAPPTPVTRRGALYEFGLEELEGQDRTSVKGVFVSGPHRVVARPELLRLDADVSGPVDFYLLYRAYDSDGAKVDENTVGVPLTPNAAIVFPYGEELTDDVATVDLYLKIVPRTTAAIVERFLLQVTSHV